MTFQAQSDGTPPLVYQWLFNDAVIAVSTNAAFRLPNVQSSDGGTYSFIATNSFGAVTSPPAVLAVIPPVPKRTVPGLVLSGRKGDWLNLDFARALGQPAGWLGFASVALANDSQWYFDLSTPIDSQGFYRAWHTNMPSPATRLDLHFVPAITVTGIVGGSVRVDAINQFGPTDAWFPLATVTLTNTSQLYFDTSSTGQPPRLWRVVPVL